MRRAQCRVLLRLANGGSGLEEMVEAARRDRLDALVGELRRPCRRVELDERRDRVAVLRLAIGGRHAEHVLHRHLDRILHLYVVLAGRVPRHPLLLALYHPLLELVALWQQQVARADLCHQLARERRGLTLEFG